MFDNDVPDSGMDLRNSKANNDDAWSRREEPQEKVSVKKLSDLDSEKMQSLHRLMLGRYESELDRQADNRVEMAIDEDFYDNIQWTPEDAATLKERGQMPLVYNVIANSVNWVLGTQKRGRTDYKVLPRRKDAAKSAERKSQLLKYLSDVNRTYFHQSRAFEDCAKVGLGWLEDGVQSMDDGEPVYSRYESWRNLLWDSACTEKDLADCRYIFRPKWVDLDVAISIFPKRAGTLRSASSQEHSYSVDSQGDEPMDSAEMERETISSSRSSDYSYQRDRVRLIEVWYRTPTTVKRMSGGDFAGEVYDEDDPATGHWVDIQEGRAEVIDRSMMRMHVAIFCVSGMLYSGESPYRHNKFPFTPIWCYRRGRDGMPYGMIRGMRDIQQDINKRASKALHIISTNKVIMDEGAVDDIDEFKEEVSRPDAVIVKKKGHELVINAERELAASHLQMMNQGMAMIQSLSGVTNENLGYQTNAISGKAINARQDQGSLATSGIFDNLRLAMQVQGEKQVSLIEQYFTEEKSFRITNMRGSPEYITINDSLPENDIARTKADFIISESAWRATLRQSQTEELMALLSQLAPVAPQLATVMIDLIVEMMDVPNGEEMVKRIRQTTGMRDPDAEEPSPEEIAAMQAQQEQQAEQKALTIADAKATIAGKEAKAQLDQSSAVKNAASTKQIENDTALKGIQAQLTSLQAAIQALTVPAAVPVADHILHETGFISRTEGEANQVEQARLAGMQKGAQQKQAQEQQEQAQQQEELQQQQQAQQQEEQQGQEEAELNAVKKADEAKTIDNNLKEM